jgi:hypothetical protein
MVKAKGCVTSVRKWSKLILCGAEGKEQRRVCENTVRTAF